MIVTEHEVIAMIPEKGTNSDKGFDGFVCLEEERIYKEKLTWMRDRRIRLLMQMEPLASRE